MKIKMLLALLLALALLTGCSTASTVKSGSEPTDEAETVTDSTEATETTETETTDGPQQEAEVTVEPAETDEPAVIESEIKHEPNPEDPGVDRGVWEYTIDYAQSGDIIYDFGDFFVTIPASWSGKYRTEITEYGDSMTMTFYQTLSEDLFTDKYGFGGGKLFSVSYSADDDYTQLPDYSVIGTSEDSRTYFLAFPTDVQAFTEDETALAEYQEMSSQYDYIIANSHMSDAVG